ncbi:hypothetical protein [Sporichthya sp.]|uniref:hypothetical protein n=1 Tax=Sporichthya sp. TaxID=65475 RepID=UPI001796EB1E|nr:hypothetical protein [Sporichthya sp.]MBA3745204.1 hypothetical protein [Sporichthya sp.]
MSAVVAVSVALAVPGLAAAESVGSSALTGFALSRFPDFAALPDSRLLGVPVMLRGTLTEPTGEPLSRAQVLVSAWPAPDVIAALPQGGQFDLVPIARTVADNTGRYELRSLLTPVLAALTGQDGLDIQVDIFHGDRHYEYLSQVRMDGRAWVRDAVNGVDGQVAALVKGPAGNLLDLAFDPAKAERLNVSAPGVSTWPPPIREGEPPLTKRDRPIPGGASCSRSTKINEHPLTAMTTVATAIVSNGATVRITYTDGAKTVTSTGVSIDSGLTFGVSGSRERSSNFTADFRDWRAKRSQSIARDFRVEVEHDVSRQVCVANANWNRYYVRYLTSPRGLSGGGDDIRSRRPGFGCDDDLRRADAVLDGVKTENAKAAVYTAAFGFAPVAGASFSGNAQSGYSEAVEVAYAFPRTVRGAWCGHTGKPLHPGQRLHGYVS